jgi:IS5 family transposase
MNDALQKAKIKQAEAKIATMKIARDAAYKTLTAAQNAGAGPDRRQRLADAYDRTEERLEAAENEARELKRKALGLTPTVTKNRPLSASIYRWLDGNINAYASPRALAVGAAETFDIPVDQQLISAAIEAWT